MEIDFVIPWVDGSDEDWIKLRNKHSGGYTDSRYREWGMLKYWFRSVEMYAPWVNKIHLITCDQVPDWLKTDHPKLNLVFHETYMPARYLPTFSSHPIELNIHRIKNLSDTFVYFNDDMFLCDNCEEEDFFQNGLPCDAAIMGITIPSVVGNQFVHILSNNLSVVNARFSKQDVIRKNWRKWFHPKYGRLNLLNLYLSVYGNFTGFRTHHLPQAFRKRDFEELWAMEPQLLEQTSLNKFRDIRDVNQYAVRILNLCKGEFYPVNPEKMGRYFELSKDDDGIRAYMRHPTGRMVCINDPDSDSMNFEQEYQFLHEVFEQAFPEKSSFEL